MNIDQAMAPVRPIISIIGSVLIAVGVLKFFGIQIPVSGSAIELAAIGYMMKAI